MAFIAKTWFYKISNQEATFFIQGHKVVSLFYQLIMCKAIVDTTVTTYQLWESLANLENYTISVSFNVDVFDLHVKNDVECLHARWETMNHIIVKLSKCYNAASESKCVIYIESKEEEYQEGEPITPDKLTKFDLNKYTIPQDWGDPTEEEK